MVAKRTVSDSSRGRKEARESIQHALDHLKRETSKVCNAPCQHPICLAVGDLEYAKGQLRG